jgi:hypothetical protein
MSFELVLRQFLALIPQIDLGERQVFIWMPPVAP